MYRKERLDKIMEIMSKKKIVDMKILEDLTYESRSTLRRDLIVLEDEHKITRNFGQVELVSDNNVEFGYQVRVGENLSDKKYIASVCDTFIGNNQALIIDSSTTASYLEPYLSKRNNLIVITNGLHLAMSLNGNPKIKTFIASGRLRPFSGSIVGDSARQFMEGFHADIAIISCAGVDKNGVYMASDEQSAVKSQMLKQAEKTILLCDHTKIDRVDYYRLCGHEDIDVIVTDKCPSEEFIQSVEDQNVEIVY
ncbi:DeoR/GlpR family DNA-binding transcription regulator [Companilactobacillus kedongensis]|uniref:DeoR/GlpR family DNA-binding transcription regulator n=1 Tax=Companilactobacillus kedongensis TaxID=2486004 RepID=UPI000F790038|nr:DeoR/GlpR family DNA-binding transcription regulator [Companilactobacillus kedongensis]